MTLSRDRPGAPGKPSPAAVGPRPSPKPKPNVAAATRIESQEAVHRHSRAELARLRGELRRARQELQRRKKAEGILATAETRLRLVIEAASLGLWDWDIKRNVIYHSPEWKRQLGYANDELTNSIDEWQSRLHPEDKAGVQAAVSLFMESPRPVYDLEFRLRHRDGSYRWIHSQGRLLLENGRPVRLLGVHIDITNRRSAEEEHARLASIVECSNDAIIGESLDGRITSWNKSAERIYGYPADEVLGRSIRMLVPRERVEEVGQILARLKRGEMIEHFETLRVRKDGRQIHVSLVISPIRDGQGEITGASAIARDITGRKQLEAEVLQISEREQQRIARDLHDGLGQLLSGTVHLINVLQLELAEQALPEAAEALRITELLNQAVAETRSLARGLYPVRPEANGLMVALQELALRTTETYKISCQFVCRKPVLISDNSVATHLYRIAQEAVTNAWKHGHACSIDLGLEATSRQIRLTVRDSGVGLPAPSLTPSGMGIRIMQYRAGMMGGLLRISPGRKAGVQVVCIVQRQGAELGRQRSHEIEIS